MFPAPTCRRRRPKQPRRRIGRGSSADYVRFCRVARGSLYEVETQIVIAAQLGYIPDDSVEAVSGQIEECSRILGGLIRSIERLDQDH